MQFISDYNDGTREAWYCIHYNLPEANIALFKHITNSHLRPMVQLSFPRQHV